MVVEIQNRSYDYPGGDTLNLYAAGTEGSDRSIILIHGWPTGGLIWKRQLAELGSRFRLLAPDLPGFGHSKPSASPTLSLMASIVRHLADLVRPSRPVLVGWSMGARILLVLADRFGLHNIGGLVLVDDCPRLLPGEDWLAGVDTRFTRQDFQRWRVALAERPMSAITRLTQLEFADYSRHQEEYEFVLRESLRVHMSSAKALIDEAFTSDYRGVLSQIDAPTLLMFGAISRNTTRANWDYVTNEVQDSSLSIFQNSAHMIMLEESVLFNNELERFVEQLPAGRSARG